MGVAGIVATIVLVAGHGDDYRNAAPAPAPSASTPTPSGSTATPTVLKASPTRRTPSALSILASMRAGLPGLVHDGQLTAAAAADLRNAVDQIVQTLQRGSPNKAANLLRTLRHQVADLHDRKQLTDAGYRQLSTMLAQVDQAMPQR